MKPLGCEKKWTCIQRQAEREFVWVTVRKLQSFWFLRQTLGLFLPRDQRLSGFIWNLCDVFCACWNAGYRRAPVDTTVKCLMHVKGTRSTRISPQLMHQSCSAWLYFMLFLSVKISAATTQPIITVTILIIVFIDLSDLPALNYHRSQTGRLSICCINIMTFGPLH